MKKIEKDYNRPFWLLFQGHNSYFSRTPFSAYKKSFEFSLAILHEQFYTEGISVVAPFPLGWIKLAPKFKEFPAQTAIFKEF